MGEMAGRWDLAVCAEFLAEIETLAFEVEPAKSFFSQANMPLLSIGNPTVAPAYDISKSRLPKGVSLFLCYWTASP
jgi:hypothetical protein